MGAGGLGGYFGARLAQAGHDVAFIARGAHLSAMRETGLHVISELGDAKLPHVVATDDPAAVGYVDWVIVAVKLWDTEAAADAAKPMIGQKTTIVSFQNGVEKDEILARIFGSDHVVGGVSYMAVKIAKPGVIEQTGSVARAIVGELSGARTDRVTTLAQMLTNARIDTQVSDDIVRATWEKFVFLVGVAGTTSLLRSEIGRSGRTLTLAPYSERRCSKPLKSDWPRVSTWIPNSLRLSYAFATLFRRECARRWRSIWSEVNGSSCHG